MKNFDKLLLVCKSNTSVSPMAEAIAGELLRLEDILIESRGLVVLFPEPINPKAEAILVSNSLSLKNHVSSPFSKDDFDPRTLILTMTQGQKEAVVEECHDDLNLYSLPEYIGSDEEVFDPYGGGMAEYGHCFEQLKVMLEKAADRLKQEEN